MKNEMLNLFLSTPEKRAALLKEFRKKEPELVKILKHIEESNAIENYSFENLKIIDIHYYSFVECVFVDCEFSGFDSANFNCCQFENCKFLEEVSAVEIFEKCKLINCDFEDFRLEDNVNISLVISQMQNCRFKSAYLDVEGIDYKFLKQFSGIGCGTICNSDLVKDDDDIVDFDSFCFEDCNFDSFDLSGRTVRLTAWDFYYCSFTNCNFFGSTIITDESDEVSLSDMDLKGVTLEGTFILDNVNLEGADLRNAEIVLTDWSNLRAVKLNPKEDISFLSLAYDLSEVNFEDWSLCEINFEGKLMHGVNFRNADLQDANFTKCDLTGSDFTGANLDGADFSGAILTKVIFDETSTEGSFFDNTIDDFKSHFRDDDYNEDPENMDDGE